MSINNHQGQLQTQVGEDEESKHILLLYDEEESLKNVFGASEELTKENWFRAYCGPASHPSIQFLRKHEWTDVTLSPYTRLVDDTKQYFNEVWQRITDEAGEKRSYAIGFMTGDLCHQSSLGRAVALEELYNGNRINGVMYCPYKLQDLLSGGAGDIIDLVKNHDQSFLVQKDKLSKIG